MNYMLLKIKETYQYSDYEIGQIRYALITISSEISKLIIMGIFFSLTNHLYEYLVATGILLCMRTNTGGIHFKHYTSCFLFSFSFMFLSIIILPVVSINTFTKLCFLLLCIFGSYLTGPVVSVYRIQPDEYKIKKFKRITFSYIFFFLLLTAVIPENHFMDVGFWIIIMQTLQLVAAKILKGVQHNEKLKQNLGTQSM